MPDYFVCCLGIANHERCLAFCSGVSVDFVVSTIAVNDVFCSLASTVVNHGTNSTIVPTRTA